MRLYFALLVLGSGQEVDTSALTTDQAAHIAHHSYKGIPGSEATLYLRTAYVMAFDGPSRELLAE